MRLQCKMNTNHITESSLNTLDSMTVINFDPEAESRTWRGCSDAPPGIAKDLWKHITRCVGILKHSGQYNNVKRLKKKKKLPGNLSCLRLFYSTVQDF